MQTSTGDEGKERTPLYLSVLDQAPVPEGSTGSQALRNSVDLARLVEKLGFHRYWVAEHHGTTSLACASPEVLISAIASATSRIRVGSGGVMLPHYSPLKVAETFSMLSGLFPARIDLGIGRAAGTDSITSSALQRDRQHRLPDDFPEQLSELLAYIWNRMPEGHPFARLAALPGLPERPEPWLLGSSPQSGSWAAELGLPYMFADFINAHGAGISRLYRERFEPSATLLAPRVGFASQVICADTDEEALRLSASYRMNVTLLHSGRRLSHVPTVETAQEFFRENRLAPDVLPYGRRVIVGSPETVRAGIEAVAQEYQAEEVMIISSIHDHAARRRSYELVADIFRN
ncbi:MAG: LLM class flavin-dependent oxidoreductase [Pseudomonadota bacterium]